MKTFKLKPAIRNLSKSVWLFPVILLFPLLILSATKISGTSIGIYHNQLYGASQHDPNLLIGKPRPIRSDEWLFITQMTIAQAKENFPRINQNVNTGRDMSLNLDVPYKEWSVIFKPQNLAFFVMPFENAFAFKWWLLLYLLAVSAYFFILRILKNRRLLSAILASGFALSPFVFWWYQTATVAPLFYGFFAMLIGMRLIEQEAFRPFSPKISKYMQIGILSYILVCFSLLLYPPFQIPIVLVVTAFLFGYLLQKHTEEKLSWVKLIQKAFVLLMPVVISLTVVGIFLATRHEAVSKIENTVYPGARVVESGGMKPLQLFSSHLQPQLQRDNKAANYYTNQSEASSFILLLPFLILPSLLISYRQLKERNVNRIYMSLQVVSLIFIAHLLIPALSSIYKIIGLDKVPHERLIIGLGFAGFLILIYTIKLLEKIKLTLKMKMIIAAYSLVCFSVLFYVGLYTREHYPKFITSIPAILILSATFAAIIFCVLYKKTLAAAVVILIFSAASVYCVQPLYRGLGPLLDSPISQRIDSISNDAGQWAVVDDVYFENLPLLSGEDSVSGIQLYPDVKFWQNVGGAQYDYIYNRYAHVIFNSDPGFTDPIRLIQFDSFQVKFSCDDFVLNNIRYAVSTHALIFPCATQVDQVNFPTKQFYLYRISQ